MGRSGVECAAAAEELDVMAMIDGDEFRVLAGGGGAM